MEVKKALITELLQDLYPGDDPLVAVARKEVERLSAMPGPAVVLLQGAPGTGKTTMARTIAVCRRLLLAPAEMRLTVESARQEVLSQKPLTWYRDISLAGLVDTLADAQLFGIGGKVATGVTARIGLFEQAMTGHNISEPVLPHDRLVAAAKEKRRWTPLVTGGVVLLDEIGDLAGGLQAKLLRVLNGERQYRLGAEGNDAYSFQYAGITVLATWRDLSSLEDFRADLWQRIRYNQIHVPGLSAYSNVSRRQIIRAIYRRFRDQAQSELDRLNELSTGTETEICSTDWLTRLARLAKQDLPPEVETELSRLDVFALGEFRGLRNVISRVISGLTLPEAIESVQRDNASAAEGHQDVRLKDLDTLATALRAESVSLAWKESRSQWARRINAMLVRRDPSVERLIAASEKRRAHIKKQLENMSRSN
jgi:hypothetical protein